MPRDVPAGLAAHLASGTLTLATLVLIVRSDGVRLGFTNADRDLAYGGDTFLATDGAGSSAVQSNAGGTVDNVEVMGVLDDARITDEDVAAGRYDGARVLIRLVNRLDLAAGHLTLLDGQIGQVRLEDGAYRADVVGLGAQLRQTVGERTSPTCRCRRLGDARCRVAMGGTTTGGTPIRSVRSVATVTDALNLRFTDAAASGLYASGIVKMLSGPNAGLEREVKRHTNVSGVARLELREAFPFAVSVGESAQLEVGCDRTFATCRDRFANANNFRGEPDLPGNQTVMRTGRGPG